MRNWLAAACAVFALALLVGICAPERFIHRVGPFVTAQAYDVAIFYCAARQVGNADPYRAEPLSTCERTTAPTMFADVSGPAPQPGYVLGALKALSWLSEERFAFVWIVGLIALALASAGFLARLTGFPAIAIFLATILGAGYENLTFGQLSMLVLFGVAGAAYALRNGHPRLATAMVALTLAEPHVALPIVVVLFALERRARLPLVIVCVAALAATFAVLGPAVTVEYFTRVLPLQALTETRNPDQYSATLLATLLGASDAVALRLGEAQYALFAIVAIFFAKRLRDRFADSAYVIAIPAAAAVIGGPFIHYSELIVLWPATLLLASRARGFARIAGALAIAVSAYPWRAEAAHWDRVAIVAAYAVFALAMTVRMRASRRYTYLAALALPISIAGFVRDKVPQIPIVSIAPRVSEFFADVGRYRDLSGVPWGLFLREHHHVLTLHEIATKLPTVAVISLLFALSVSTLRREPVSPLPQPAPR